MRQRSGVAQVVYRRGELIAERAAAGRGPRPPRLGRFRHPAVRGVDDERRAPRADDPGAPVHPEVVVPADVSAGLGAPGLLVPEADVPLDGGLLALHRFLFRQERLVAQVLRTLERGDGPEIQTPCRSGAPTRSSAHPAPSPPTAAPPARPMPPSTPPLSNVHLSLHDLQDRESSASLKIARDAVAAPALRIGAGRTPPSGGARALSGMTAHNPDSRLLDAHGLGRRRPAGGAGERPAFARRYAARTPRLPLDVAEGAAPGG